MNLLLQGWISCHQITFCIMRPLSLPPIPEPCRSCGLHLGSVKVPCKVAFGLGDAIRDVTRSLVRAEERWRISQSVVGTGGGYSREG